MRHDAAKEVSAQNMKLDLVRQLALPKYDYQTLTAGSGSVGDGSKREPMKVFEALRNFSVSATIHR